MVLFYSHESKYHKSYTQIFLRESEKMRLDEALHSAIMERVVKIQRWIKTIQERQNYHKLREASIITQV